MERVVMLSYKDAQARRIVRLPSGDQAVLLWVKPGGTRGRARILGTGRHWQGRLEVLEPTDFYMHQIADNHVERFHDDGQMLKDTG